jgi:hypothetical protein
MRRPDMDKLDYGPIIAEDADKNDEDLDMTHNCGQNLWQFLKQTSQGFCTDLARMTMDNQGAS